MRGKKGWEVLADVFSPVAVKPEVRTASFLVYPKNSLHRTAGGVCKGVVQAKRGGGESNEESIHSIIIAYEKHGRKEISSFKPPWR